MALLSATLVGALRRGGAPTAPADLVADVAAFATPTRPDEPRFSVEYAPGREPWEQRLILRARRGRTMEITAARAALAARLTRRAAAGDDPSALHAVALVDLRWEDTTARARARAVEQLAHAARLAPRAPAILVDLAAARLLEAEHDGRGRALVEAADAAGRAVALAPQSLAARYNLMLALDRLGCTEQAAEAARAYLASDGTSERAAVARRTAARAIGSHTPDVLGEGDPETARRAGWDDALGRWGAATAAGDTAGARTALQRARRLGVSLARRSADRSLPDAVAAIDVMFAPPQDVRALTALAISHRDLAEGDALYGRGAYRAARDRYARVLARHPPSRPLRQWARAMLGASLVHDGRPVEGARVLNAVLAEVDALRYPAIAGRAHATLGTSLFRRGLDADAERHATAAAEVYGAAAERENLGSAQMLRADIVLARGDRDLGYDRAVQALTTLRASPGSLWRHTMLGVLAVAALADGLPQAAARIQDEDVTSAARANRPSRYTEALLLRVRLEAATGNRRHSAEDLRVARRIIAALPPGIERDWSTADLNLAAALDGLGTAPDAAARAADTAVAFFAGTRNLLRLFPALAARADAHVAGGRVPDALRDLTEAAAIVGDRASKLGGSAQRALLLAQARHVLARAVLLQVANGRPRAALVTLERARALLAGGTTPTAGITDPRRWTGRDELGVAYLRLADTLLVWTVARGQVALTRRTIDGAGLVATLALARGLLEHRAPETRIRPVLADLYEVLVRPIEPRVRDTHGTLVLAVDGDLSSAPFAGLYDARGGRYLVETHALRFVTSLAEGGAVRAARAPAGRVVLVGATAPASDAAGELAALPGAAAELTALRSVYPGARTLDGRTATPTALLAALRGATVFHFAGHAVFDDVRPDRSYLALAGPATQSRLSAADLAARRLGRVRLVVLSACQTTGGAAQTLGGMAGIAAALRAAGAEGVMASTWRVDDATTGPLMVYFHRAFRATGRGPDALRAAQQRMLASPAPLRSPSAWAAFRLVGR